MHNPLLAEYEKISQAEDTGATPIYVRLRDAIQNSIETGAIGPGHALPSERELAAMLGMSRVTVRKAIAGLVESGLLSQRQGAGTFVADRIIKSFSRLTCFTDDLRARGLDPRSKFLERSIGEVSPEEAMALNLSPGAPVVRLHRLRYAGQQPLAIEKTVVPYCFLPDPTIVGSSLYETFDRLGCRPKRALQRLRAILFDREQAQLLEVSIGSPGLAIERRAFLEDGRVVEFTNSFYRGDAYDFVAELQSE